MAATPDPAVGSINNKKIINDYGVIAHGAFDATAGSISSNSQVGCAVTYVSTGVYLVTFDDAAIDDNFYTVSVSIPQASRLVYVNQKTTNSFRINNTNLSSTLTDASAILEFAVFGLSSI